MFENIKAHRDQALKAYKSNTFVLICVEHIQPHKDQALRAYLFVLTYFEDITAHTDQDNKTTRKLTKQEHTKTGQPENRKTGTQKNMKHKT